MYLKFMFLLERKKEGIECIIIKTVAHCYTCDFQDHGCETYNYIDQ